MQERSKLQAIFEGKCPRCRKGDLFTYPISHITNFYVTNKNCPSCNLRFEQEPGFFFGAMYISYAFVVAILLITAVLIYNLFNDPPLIAYIITVPLVVIISLPFLFRYSRIFYLYLVGGIYYNKKYAGE
ncbi:DUF983 domain-containing protein [soil metagenome]